MSAAVDTVVELNRRFSTGDMAGALELFHPRIRIEQPSSLPHGGWYTGHDGVAAMGKAFGEHWTRAIVDPRISGSDELVVQVTTQTWTAKATGREATVDVVELLTVEDGKVTQIRVFQQDTHLLLKTLEA